MSTEPKATDGASNPPDPTKFVPKEEYEAQKSTLSKLQADLERVRGELLDPSYLEYLESKKDKAVKKLDASSDVKDALGTLTADEIERLPKSRLLEIAEKRISDKLTGELREEFKKTLAGLQVTVQNLVYEKELNATKSKYSDFDEYKDEIQKILERPNANYTYEDAYLIARSASGKAPAAKASTKPAEKRSSSEKPSSTAPADDFKQKDFKDKDDASNAAIASVRAKYGIEGDII